MPPKLQCRTRPKKDGSKYTICYKDKVKKKDDDDDDKPIKFKAKPKAKPKKEKEKPKTSKTAHNVKDELAKYEADPHWQQDHIRLTKAKDRLNRQLIKWGATHVNVKDPQLYKRRPDLWEKVAKAKNRAYKKANRK